MLKRVRRGTCPLAFLLIPPTDYNILLALLPPSSPQTFDIQKKLRILKPRLEAAQKRETAEMMDKLKGLGNSFLGTSTIFELNVVLTVF